MRRLDSELIDASPPVRDTCIINKNVELSESRFYRGDKLGNRRRIANIAGSS
jgi:hypothetical protein